MIGCRGTEETVLISLSPIGAYICYSRCIFITLHNNKIIPKIV